MTSLHSPFKPSPPDIHSAEAVVAETRLSNECGNPVLVQLKYRRLKKPFFQWFDLPPDCNLKKGDKVEIIIRKLP